MNQQWYGVLALALTTGIAFGAALQEEPEERKEPSLYAIYAEQVKPSMIQEYETATKDLIEELVEYKADPEKVNFFAVSGPEMGYVFVIPLENFASIDKVRSNWTEVIGSMGQARWEALAARSDACITSREILHAVRRSDLSYAPKDPELDPDDVKVIHYSFYDVIPGKEADLEAVVKDYVELYAEHGIEAGWTIYQSVTGPDLPRYVVTEAAESVSGFHAREERIRKKLGNATKELGERAMACTRQIQFKFARIRPDLSYPPRGDDD